MEKVKYVPIENCGIGTQLIGIAHGLMYRKDYKIIILDNIEYIENNGVSHKNILTKFFNIKNCQVIKEPINDITDKIYNNSLIRKKLFTGEIKDDSILTLNKLGDDYITNNKINGSFINKIDSTDCILNVLKNNITVVNNPILVLNRNNKYKNSIGFHIRLVNDKLFNPIIVVPLLLKAQKIKDKKYISIDNYKLFCKKGLNNVISPNTILEYDNRDSTEDYNHYYFCTDDCYKSEIYSMQVAINLASCKDFFGSYNSAYSNILVPLLRFLIQG